MSKEISVKCQICAKDFSIRRRSIRVNKPYICSSECKKEYAKKQKISSIALLCEQCGNEHHGEHGSGRFCSIECSTKFSSNTKRLERNIKISKALKAKGPKFEKVSLVCEECGIEFIVLNCMAKTRRYCGHTCASKNIVKDSSISFSERNYKAYANGRKVTGGNTKWLSYKNIKVQGTYELRTCYILDRLKDLSLIHTWEYTDDRYAYIGEDGKEHTYLLDFKVFENPTTFYYIETKGYQIPNDLLKWEAVTALGYKLIIWFIKDIVEQELLLNKLESERTV